MNNAEVGHRFAAQWGTPVSEMTAKAEGSNMSFRGPLCYSWYTVIGRFAEHEGKPYMVVNATTYSKYTSRHKSAMLRGTSHIEPKFYYEGEVMGVSLDVTGEMLYEYQIKLAAGHQAKAIKAKMMKASYLKLAEEALRCAQRISDFFGLKKKADEKAIEKLAKEKAKAEKQYAKEMAEQSRRYEERRLQRIEEAKVHLKEWLSGDSINISVLYELPVHLRSRSDIHPEVNPVRIIETSRGAVIPYEDGRRCYRFCARLWRRDEAWHRNGEQFEVGPYKLEAVNRQGIVAGCHRIDREEIERFAKQEGWVQLNECIRHRIEDGWLVITGHPDDDAKDIHEALERMVSNCELSWISPNETGDMTEAPILGIRDEHGNATDQRWGYMDYAVTDPLEELREKGEIRFQPAS